ncbi:MAG: preprotein translocase subunit SecE [Pirellulales bacterium]|nr:preprotein translocase subunit SecE [Pirellulales bacterium]
MANVFLQTGTYKRSQGRIARQATFASIAAIIGLGAWRFSALQQGKGVVWEIVVPLAILLVGAWLSFRLVQWPKFADFLIAVEAEMNKVSWPTRAELFRASMVVLATIFIMTIALFAFDYIWTQIFWLIGIKG